MKIFKQIILIFNKKKSLIQDVDVMIQDVDVIKCEIQTPQFHGCKEKFNMKKQTGTFYKSDMKFIHDGLFGHNVQFHDLNDFKKSLLRLL